MNKELLLLQLLFFWSTVFSDEIYPDSSNNVVHGIIGKDAEVPCNLSMNDSVKIVTWMKHTNTKKESQIYAFDARKVPLVMGIHHTRDPRLSFMPLERPPHLFIKAANLEDEGFYTCTVDYKKLGIMSNRSYLTIIVPPDDVKIFDLRGNEVQEESGPYKENDTVEFVCKVTGGKPVPIVTWWKGPNLLSGESGTEGDEVVTNKLTIGPITRAHLHAKLSCQTSNSKLTAPISKMITMEVQFQPLTAKILTPQSPLTASKEYHIKCQSDGGRPPAEITWWLDEEKLSHTEEYTTNSGNTTLSTLMFTPMDNDGGKRLECRSGSSAFPDKVLTDHWNLNIHYKPKIKLSMMPDSVINEGYDVTFYCNVTSNPPPTNITWYYKGKEIGDRETKVKIGDSSMTVFSVTRKDAGLYTCVTSNSVGIGKSDAAVLKVHYIPVCSTSEEQLVGASYQEVIKVHCNLKTSPKVSSFRWQFNSSGEMIDLVQDQFTIGEKTSVLTYSPKTASDFGTLLCWGKNELGEQEEPCIFHVIEASFPEKPQNCTFFNNNTSTNVYVRCIEGHDGGLPQRFVAEVFDMSRKEHTMNVTQKEPFYALENLPSGTDFMLTIYSINNKGSSEKQLMQVYTTVSLQGNIFPFREPHVFPITAILGVLIGVVGALVLVAIIVVVVMRLRSTPSNKKPPKDDAKGLSTPLRHSREDGDAEFGNGREPEIDVDGIPNKLKHANLYETVAYETKQSPDGSKNSENAADTDYDTDADDVEYAELTFYNGKIKPKSKIKTDKNSSKSNGKIHSFYDPTLYASIDHIKTETKKLDSKPNDKSQNANKKEEPICDSKEQAPSQKQQLIKTSSKKTPPLLPTPLEDTQTINPNFITPLNHHAPKGLVPEGSQLHNPVETSLKSQPDQKIFNQDPNPSKPQEIISKKLTGKPTNLDKPLIGKKPSPTLSQGAVKQKKKKTVETQTANLRENRNGKNLSNDAKEDNMPLIASTAESNI